MRRRHSAVRRRRWSELRERRRQTIFLLPGLLTTGNLLAGFYAIVLTFDGRHQWAALALFIGMVLDMLDGKVARLTRTTTQFGVEFDSLADVVSFGVAPGLLLYSWALQPLGRVGAGAAALYVICGALRLARFNVLTGRHGPPLLHRAPDPGRRRGGGVDDHLLRRARLRPLGLFALACATYVLAFLMISNIRYYSFKDLNFAKRHPFGVLLVAALGILIVFAHPDTSVFLVFCAYAVSGPVRWLLLRQREPAPPMMLREAPRSPGPARDESARVALSRAAGRQGDGVDGDLSDRGHARRRHRRRGHAPRRSACSASSPRRAASGWSSRKASSAARRSTPKGTPLRRRDPPGLPRGATRSCSGRSAGPSGTTCRPSSAPSGASCSSARSSTSTRTSGRPGCTRCSSTARPLKRSVVEGADLLVIRELTGGLYFGEPRGIEGSGDARRGFNTMAYTAREIERIADLAFRVARGRRRS